MQKQIKKPSWLKVTLPSGQKFNSVNKAVLEGNLHTVCQSAMCPNKGECWNQGTATFMILGDTCTRGCQFCAVKRGNPRGVQDDSEPDRIADATLKMALDYVVITSVTRDDLLDGGAGLFAQTIAAVKQKNPSALVEILTSDYTGDDLKTVLDAEPDVFAHNIEVVKSLSSQMRHARFSYENSLRCLEQAGQLNNEIILKSSIMLGLGESNSEIIASMEDLRNVGVQILAIGQYLQPTANHAPVTEYIQPDQFDLLAQKGYQMGFNFVTAGPLVRTSYKAATAYVKSKKAN